MADAFDSVVAVDLTVGQNTLVTQAQALLLVKEMVGVGAFVNAEPEVQIAALMEAYERVASMELRLRVLPPEVSYKDSKEVRSIGELNALDLTTLSLQMRKAFMKAQVYEADFILGGDPVTELRKQGIMSYTVGEVKQFFRTVKPLDFTLSMRAMNQIGKYLQYSRGVARA